MIDPPARRKRLALFLDGTWNNLQDNTNVWRLRSLCAERGADGWPQLCYYDPGVGSRFGERFRGGALGYGLSRNVVAAYRWLIENYNRGDAVYIFGFSRGAYTARSLAGLIAKCGLLAPGAPLSVEQVYERYQKGAELRPLYTLKYQERHGGTPFSLEEQWLLRYSFRIPIRLVAVWDTVGALGIPFGNIPGLSRRRLWFHHTRLSNIFEHAYQALAIDEHRKAFVPSLWTRFIPKVAAGAGSDSEAGADAAASESGRPRRFPRVEQRWFVGAHANIGGGYRHDLLAQVPLAWIMEKAGATGLAFRFGVNIAGDEHLSPVADSYARFLRGLYRPATFGRRHYRVIGYPRSEKESGFVETANETIDATVFDRWRRDPAYRPPNLAAWARNLRRDPSEVQGTVSAVDATPC